MARAGPAPALSGTLKLQFFPRDDLERLVGCKLTKQRDGIDGDVVDRKRGESLPQAGKNLVATRIGEPSRQRHVESEILEHVRISEAVDMADLSRRQPRLQAARSLGFGERRAEAVELRDAIVGEI